MCPPYHYGRQGDPYDGVLERCDRFVYLDVDANLHPGMSFQAKVVAVESGLVGLFFGEHETWLDLPHLVGPPFALLPGGFFLGFWPGRIGANGELDVSLTLINDPIVRGFPLSAQAVVLGEEGEIFTSNAVVRVIGA
ncbi:MAG: hypothetical protein AB1486_09905 [Planctomycetota bacterium]